MCSSKKKVWWFWSSHTFSILCCLDVEFCWFFFLFFFGLWIIVLIHELHFHLAVFGHYLAVLSHGVAHHLPALRFRWFAGLVSLRHHHSMDCPMAVAHPNRTNCRMWHMQCTHQPQWRILFAIGPSLAINSENRNRSAIELKKKIRKKIFNIQKCRFCSPFHWSNCPQWLAPIGQPSSQCNWWMPWECRRIVALCPNDLFWNRNK